MFHPKRGNEDVLFGVGTEKGNEVKIVLWLQRTAHFQAIIGQDTSVLCGQNHAYWLQTL